MMQVFLLFIGLLIACFDISLTILSVVYWFRGIVFAINGDLASFSTCMMFSLAIIFSSIPFTYTLKYINIKLKQIRESEDETH